MPHDPIASRSVTAPITPARGIRIAHLLAVVVALMGLDNLLLLRFVGVEAPLIWASATSALVVVLIVMVRQTDMATVPVRRLLLCLAIGFGVMALGGEGRFFYANYDWVIRDTVLADMARWPWPYAYTGHGVPMMLRAPIGMYLLPAIAGELGGQVAADIAMLVQNSAMLGLLLAIGSTLFETAHRRRIALAVLLVFSGMDAIGALLSDPASLLLSPTTHIENWTGGVLQYSANLTLAFWVPQHASVGWLGALLFLLWREERLALSRFLATVPLMMLWSPLGVMGTIPFAAYAGIETLLRRKLAFADIMLPALSLIAAAVPLVYLQADAGAVGIHAHLPDLRIYVLFILLEAVPLLWAVWSGSRGARIGRVGFAIVAACLLAFPFVTIGVSADFVMRASITPLAILAVLVADLFMLELSRKFMSGLLAILLIGSVTPARELLRALAFRPTPTPRCDLWTAWDHSFPAFTKTTYLAPVASLPGPLRTRGIHLESPIVSSHCWDRPWDVSRFAD